MLLEGTVWTSLDSKNRWTTKNKPKRHSSNKVSDSKNG